MEGVWWRLVDAVQKFGWAARSLARRPLLTVVTMVTLSVGIGAVTAMYSFVDGILLSPLSYRESERLRVVQLVIPELSQFPLWNPNARAVDAWQRTCERYCSDITALGYTSAVAGQGEAAELLNGARVLPGFFDVLGVDAFLGRVLRPEDGEIGRARVVVLTNGLWERRYGRDRSVLGRRITLDGQRSEVVGILPASFRSPQLSSVAGNRDPEGVTEFFEPLIWGEAQRRSVGGYDYSVVLRLPGDRSDSPATAELNSILEGAFAATQFNPRAYLRPMVDEVVGAAGRPLVLLLAATLGLLVVATTNVSNLLGVRWLERRHELTLRRALGAPPLDAVAGVLRESLLLALSGGVCGLLVAHAGLRALVAAAPASLPRLEEVGVDAGVVGVVLGVTLSCGVLCSIAPGWQTRRVGRMEALAIRNAASLWRGRVPNLLIGVQAALGVTLLVVTGLLLVSLMRVMRVDPGFEMNQILAADIQFLHQQYGDAGEVPRAYSEVLRALATVPGVRAVGVVQRLPLEGNSFIDSLARADDVRPAAEHALANYRLVSPDYLRVMGIGVIRGRMFAEGDRNGRPIVVSERTAMTLWPGDDPIGRFVRNGAGELREVVGVASDARIVGIEANPGIVAYVPYWEFSERRATLVVRTEADPEALISAVIEELGTVDPALPVYNFRTMAGVLSDAVAGRHFLVELMAGFAVVSTLLVGFGVYGVVAAAVSRRRAEMAVRTALGAPEWHVIGVSLGYGLRPMTVGAICGVVPAVIGGQMVATLLYEVEPYDWTVLTSAMAVVFVVALSACLIPAARAARTPTTILLRKE